MVDNVLGWDKLLQGNIFGAVFDLFNSAMAGWAVFILFGVFQSVLYIKTRNIVMMWITGFFFAAMFTTSIFLDVVLNKNSVYLMFTLLVIELAGILYFTFFT